MNGVVGPDWPCRRIVLAGDDLALSLDTPFATAPATLAARGL